MLGVGVQYHKTLQKSGDETKKPNVNNGLVSFLRISHDHIFLGALRGGRCPKQKVAKNDTIFGISFLLLDYYNDKQKLTKCKKTSRVCLLIIQLA